MLTLMTVIDDATKRLLYAEFFERRARGGHDHSARGDQQDGLPMACTPIAPAGGVHPPSRRAAGSESLTQVGRALKQLGSSTSCRIAAGSRRTERPIDLARPPVQRDAVAGIRTLAKRMRISGTFITDYNANFAVPRGIWSPLLCRWGDRPRLDPLPPRRADRGRDNTVVLDEYASKSTSSGTRTCAG